MTIAQQRTFLTAEWKNLLMLNYAVDPDPPLFGADEEWADEWLHEKGLRPQRKPPRRKRKPKSK